MLPKTALNSPPPDAGMIISTPLLVYLALMTSLGIVTTASNGLVPSPNLYYFNKNKFKFTFVKQWISDTNTHTIDLTVKLEAPNTSMSLRLIR
jgi:hypothetical protein